MRSITEANIRDGYKFDASDYRARTIRQNHLPYLLHRLSEKPDSKLWIILNREYKPLGIWPDLPNIDYETHPSRFYANITEKLALKISCHPDANDDRGKNVFRHHWPYRVYLYNDGLNPERGLKEMKAYLERLAVLMKIKTGNPTDCEIHPCEK